MGTARYIILLLLCICFTRSLAQDQNLQDAIRFMEKKYKVVFSYDVELTRAVPVRIDSSESDIKKLIQQLNTRTAFHFEFINNNNVILKPKYSNQNFLLCGAVFDSKTREPLLGSLVYQWRSKYGVYAGEDGSFFKPLKYDAGDSIVVACIGYEKIILPIGYFAGGCKQILLESQRIQMSEVAVTAYLTTGVSYDASDNSINIHPKNLTQLPGNVNGDILSSLDALPGISTPDGKAGNLNIRGSTPDQTLINVDDIPVYLKGHYFGTISPINPNAVDNIKVQRSTMSVNKGGRAGGLVDIHTSNNVANKFSSTISASALDANAYVHAPLIKDKLSIAASGRRSYPYSVENPALSPISDFVFEISEIRALLDGVSKETLTGLGFDYSDANAKMNYNLTQKHKGSLSYLFIENNMFVNRESRSDNTNQGDKIRMNNWGVNSSLHSNWSSKLNSYLSLTHSSYAQTFTTKKTNFKMDSLISDAFFENRATDSRLLFETDWQFVKHFTLKTGYDGRYQDISYLRRTDNRSNTSFLQSFINQGTVHSAYTTLAGTVRSRFLFNLGLRANYFTVTKAYSFEPRLFMSCALNNYFRLKLSGGYQKQFVTQVSGISIESIGGLENQLWLLADNVNIPEVNSTQGSFGGMFEKNSWLIDMEGYYRNVTDITSISVLSPLAPNPYIHGSIETKGVDVLVRKQYKSFDTWVSYSLSESLMQFDSINDGEQFSSLYDQTHILDVAGSYRISQWKFSLAWKYRTGLAALPGIRTRMIHGAPSGQQSQQPQQPRPPGAPAPASPTGGYSDRYPDYHQLDASLYYMFPKEVKKYKGSAGVSLINIYDQHNIIEQIPNKNTFRDKTMPGFTPNFFITISF
jgi:ferric enterobactin receptor